MHVSRQKRHRAGDLWSEEVGDRPFEPISTILLLRPRTVKLLWTECAPGQLCRPGALCRKMWRSLSGDARVMVIIRGTGRRIEWPSHEMLGDPAPSSPTAHKRAGTVATTWRRRRFRDFDHIPPFP